MKNKILFLSFLLLSIGVLLFTFPQEVSTPTCENYGVIYLKPNELGLASKLTDKAGIVVIPLMEHIQVRTDLSKCENINPTDYLSPKFKEGYLEDKK